MVVLPNPAAPRHSGQMSRFLPGLQQLLRYRREWLASDLVAGVSVAAVAIPTAIAYAQLIGFEPIVGLYAAILPLVVYALFGTSRQLMVNPDAATCAVFAAAVVPLAGGDHEALVALSVGLSVLTGVICITAGLFRLGFVADFLAKPILVGYLNGVAISIFLGQIGKVFGFPLQARGIVPRLVELVQKLPQTHWPTLGAAVATLAIILGSKRVSPRLPAPLLAAVGAIVIVYVMDLEPRGVAVVGALPAGLPDLRWPRFDPALLKPLLFGAAGVALMSFSSDMVTARSFAARNRYDLDPDQEFVALGACQVAAGVSQGFAVSGADSRTAVNDAMGGKSQMVGLVAAATMTVVLFFLTDPLRYLPIAALGAVLIVAAIGLFDAPELVRMWRVRRSECALAVATMLGVIWLDVLDGVLIAVGCALLLLVKRASRPHEAVLGRVAGLGGWHSVADYPEAKTEPGLVVYRFASSLVFFNAGYFKKRMIELAESSRDVRWIVLDGSPINLVDVTGADTLDALVGELAERGVRLGFANVRREVSQMLDRAGVLERLGPDAVFPALDAATDALRARR
jgi:high affinity sulfate transporter 1